MKSMTLPIPTRPFSHQRRIKSPATEAYFRQSLCDISSACSHSGAKMMHPALTRRQFAKLAAATAVGSHLPRRAFAQNGLPKVGEIALAIRSHLGVPRLLLQNAGVVPRCQVLHVGSLGRAMRALALTTWTSDGTFIYIGRVPPSGCSAHQPQIAARFQIGLLPRPLRVCSSAVRHPHSASDRGSKVRLQIAQPAPAPILQLAARACSGKM